MRKQLRNILSTKYIILLLCGCSSNAQSNNNDSTWQLTEDVSSPVSENDLIPTDEFPIVIPVGSYDWQMDDSNIVVHTALQSEHQYDNVRLKYGKESVEAGLIIDIELGVELSRRSWVFIEGVPFSDQQNMHFFEIFATPKERLEGKNNTGPFLWKVSDDSFVYSQYEGSVEIIVKRLVNRDIENDQNISNISSKWSDFSSKCINKCILNAYLWHPQSDEIIQIELEGQYVSIDPPSRNIPLVLIREKN